MITGNRFFHTSWINYKGKILDAAESQLGIHIRGIDKGEPLHAYVNHGRWVVKCECGGCEKAWEECEFICQSCWNSRAGHKIRRVVFPKTRKAIEAILSERPLVNRNWKPGESLAFLKLENKGHKTELLEVRQ